MRCSSVVGQNYCFQSDLVQFDSKVVFFFPKQKKIFCWVCFFFFFFTTFVNETKLLSFLFHPQAFPSIWVISKDVLNQSVGKGCALVRFQ